MITRIELTNFMSHEHTVIEPAAGLTVLVGPNNVGKSAVVAALQILAQNETSSYAVRHGERECSVQVHTDDGHIVQWRRKTSPSYVIDGQIFDRLGRSGLPDELHRALRLPRVDSGSEGDFDVHFGAQKSPVFLLDSSPANAARFFASSSDAIRLVAMQKRHKEKLTEAQREKKRLDQESRELNAQLEILEPVVEVDRRLTAAEQAYGELVQLEARIEAANKESLALEEQAAVCMELKQRAGALGSLSPPPELIDLSPLQRLIDQTEQEASQHQAASSRLSALRNLSNPPVMKPIERLAELINSLERAQTSIQCIEQERHSLAQVSAPPILADTHSLQILIDRLVHCSNTLQATRERTAVLETAPPPPVVLDEGPLSALVMSLTSHALAHSRWQKTLISLADVSLPQPAADIADLARTVFQFDLRASELQESRAVLQAAEKSLDDAREELRRTADGALCPICGSPLDPEQVVQRAVSGLGGHDHE